jgi:hypothetical protein
MNNNFQELIVFASIADPGNFDPDPNPAFHCDTDPDPTVWYGSRSLLFQIGSKPKMVLF